MSLRLERPLRSNPPLELPVEPSYLEKVDREAKQQLDKTLQMKPTRPAPSVDDPPGDASKRAPSRHSSRYSDPRQGFTRLPDPRAALSQDRPREPLGYVGNWSSRGFASGSPGSFGNGNPVFREWENFEPMTLIERSQEAYRWGARLYVCFACARYCK